MTTFKKATEEIVELRDERNWETYHKPKDVAISVAIEAAELMELFQWKTDEEVQEFVATNKETIADEMVDVLNYLMVLAHDTGIDLLEAAHSKNKKIRKKYPVDVQLKEGHKKV